MAKEKKSYNQSISGEDVELLAQFTGKLDKVLHNKRVSYLRNQKETKMNPHLFDILWEVNRDTGGRIFVIVANARAQGRDQQQAAATAAKQTEKGGRHGNPQVK